MNRKESCDLFHSLVTLAEAKAFLGTDDREDSLVGFLLAASTYAIEEYCMRRLLRKRVKESFIDTVETVFTLREYPVAAVSAVGVADRRGGIEPALYGLSPEAGGCENYPFTLRLLSTPCRARSVFVKYIAGYSMAKVPPDLKEACLELAAWKLQRHNMRFAGIADNKGGGDENKMPECVKELLEAYRRKVL
ncbi:MAG: hypothetical protein LBK66_10120 [Spirochaetaceae bacterium]|jgi:uncharacterized phiE125 gp8 family phage protein|nr:hypothetical protein [Spirochaetaceae bacterium]